LSKGGINFNYISPGAGLILGLVIQILMHEHVVRNYMGSHQFNETIVPSFVLKIIVSCAHLFRSNGDKFVFMINKEIDTFEKLNAWLKDLLVYYQNKSN
jgi:hypothetical protein